MSTLPDRLDAALTGQRAPEEDTAPLLAVLVPLEPLRPVPPRTFGAAQAGRQAFLAEAASLRPAPRPTGWNRVAAFMQQHRALATGLSVLIVLMVVLTSLGGTAYAAQASGPGDSLYSVKLLTEDVRLGLAADPQERLDTLLEMCRIRTAEMAALAERHQPVPGDVPARLQAQLSAALQIAARMGDAELAPALERMRVVLQAQTQTLARVHGDAGLAEAQRILVQAQAAIAVGLEDPGRFRRAVLNGVQAPMATPGPAGGRTPVPGAGPGNGPGPQTPQATPHGQGAGPMSGQPTAGAGTQAPGQPTGPQPTRGPQGPGNSQGPDSSGTPAPGGGEPVSGTNGQAGHGGRRP